jgi:nucleoside-diphosphate-sugar epimerase
MKFTILGGNGFIGTSLHKRLLKNGHDVFCPSRHTEVFQEEMGYVIDCVGLTSDFRERKKELFETHVSRVDRLIQNSKFESYLYLSSTRVYKGGIDSFECSGLTVNSCDFDDIYNISKIAGEAVCLQDDSPNVRVARLSNVVGLNRDPAVFLTSLISDALISGRVVLRESPQSSKDYIGVDDVCRYLEEISLSGQERIYNVAYGEPQTHSKILGAIQTEIPFELDAPEGPIRSFPRIDNGRLVQEFGHAKSSPLEMVRQVARTLANEFPG